MNSCLCLQDYLEKVPGRKRLCVTEEEEDNKDDMAELGGKAKKKKEKEDLRLKKDAAKKKKLERKSWKTRRNNLNPEISRFLSQHAKESKRWIEACCT